MEIKKRRMTCILCPIGCVMEVGFTNGETYVSENKCKQGIKYARTELVAPRRTLTTTVRVYKNGKKNTAPVRTDGDIPKHLLFDAMNELNKIEINHPAPRGTAVVKNLLGTGVDAVLTEDVR